MRKIILGIFLLLTTILLVSCSKKKYIVNFDTNGGSPKVSDQRVFENGYAKLPNEDVTKDGYDFIYWSYEDEKFEFDEIKITHNITLVAKWKETVVNDGEFNIKFDTNGGNAISDIKLSYGSYVPKIIIPSKEGYKFLGWLLDGVSFDLNTPVTTDLILVASWQKVDNFDVTFYFNYENGPSKLKYKVNIGETINEITKPVRKHYIFKYWEHDGLRYDFNQTVTEDIELFAKWELDENNPPLVKDVVLSEEYDFTVLDLDYDLKTNPVEFIITNLVEKTQSMTFERRNSRIYSNDDANFTGVGLIMGKDSFYEDSYLMTKSKVSNAAMIELSFSVWGDMYKQNLELVNGIYVQTSTDGISWKNIINLKESIKNEDNFETNIEIKLSEQEEVYVRVLLDSSNIQSKNEFRILIDDISFHTYEEPYVGLVYETEFIYNYTDSPTNFIQYNKEDRSIKAPNNPIRDGYRFNGWYEYGASHAFDFNSIYNRNIVLYATWEEKSESDNPSDYDDNILAYYVELQGLVGDSFNDELRRIIKTNGKATGSTSEVKKADKYQGKNYNIYDGFGTYGNREHVWPNSKLNGAPKYDLQNLRAAIVGTNSTRSNYPYGEGSGRWKLLQGNKFYPGDEHVGDVARIILYISVRYNLNVNTVGTLPLFLKWHKQDPVSDFERSRNNNIQDIQQNRNPFIDYPDYVDSLFGTTQASTLDELMLNLNFGSFLSISDVNYELMAFVEKREYIS